MKRFKNLILLITLVVGVCSYDNKKISDLSPEAAEELVYMIKHYPDLKPNCTGHPPARSADFFLYNRQNPTTPTKLDGNNLDLIDISKDATIIIHGWLSTATNVDILKLKDAYNTRYDNNIILVDWTEQASRAYTKAYCDVPNIARAVNQFLCTIVRKLNMPLSKFHVLGHNHGAQIAGFAGQYVSTSCEQKIGRITGLDPAGPGFWLLKNDQKLDSSDGDFVQAIHTDERSIGSPEETIGDVDFHPNCGLQQPGCPSMSNIDDSTAVKDALCSTIRSIDYMLESMTSNELIGISCSLCARYCRPDIINEVYEVMGEPCQKIPKPGYNFYIDTNDAPPYGKGWDAYPYGSVSLQNSTNV